MATVDITAMEESKDPEVRAQAREMLEEDKALRAQMSPAGALNLPPLLDQRRMKYGIPDGFFKRTPLFDRVLVFQIELVESDKFEGSSIVRPESVRSRERQEACRGVVIAAGLLALDQLRSNGSELGHIVTFIKQAPWRIPMDYVKGKAQYALLLNAGDICADETLNERLAAGVTVQGSALSPDGVEEHFFVGQGKPLNAYQPGGY